MAEPQSISPDSITADVRQKFNAKHHVDEQTGCWTWTGRRHSKGYGVIESMALRYPAHRVSYLLHVGPIPHGLVIDHLCRNRSCVNPAHLEPVTNGENVLRGTSVAAVHWRATHCFRGHEFTLCNTRIKRDGGKLYRSCIECRRQREAAARMDSLTDRRHKPRKVVTLPRDAQGRWVPR